METIMKNLVNDDESDTLYKLINVIGKVNTYKLIKIFHYIDIDESYTINL